MFSMLPQCGIHWDKWELRLHWYKGLKISSAKFTNNFILLPAWGLCVQFNILLFESSFFGVETLVPVGRLVHQYDTVCFGPKTSRLCVLDSPQKALYLRRYV